MRSICFLLVLAAVLLSTGYAGAAGSQGQPRSGADRAAGTLPWDEYWKLVDDTRLLIRECEQIPLDQAQTCLDKSISRWQAIDSVELPDGRITATDPSYLLFLLRMDSPDLARIDQLLGEMLAERGAIGAVKPPGEALARLNDILSQPEFQWKEQSQPNALERLWQRIQQALSDLGQRVLSLPGANSLIGAGALLVLCGMILFLFRHLLSGFVAESRYAPRSQAGGEVLTADSALQRAQDLSQGGDYRSAVRYLYLSALLLLEERGLLIYDRTKTNRETLRSVSGQPGLEEPLRSVVEVFDRVWYGYQPLEDRDYQFYERQVGRLRQQRPVSQQKNDGEM